MYTEKDGMMLLPAMTLTTAVINGGDLLYSGALQRTDPSVSAHTKNHTKRQADGRTEGWRHRRTDCPAISVLLSAIHASYHHRHHRQQQQQQQLGLADNAGHLLPRGSNVICHLTSTSNNDAWPISLLHATVWPDAFYSICSICCHQSIETQMIYIP